MLSWNSLAGGDQDFSSQGIFSCTWLYWLNFASSHWWLVLSGHVLNSLRFVVFQRVQVFIAILTDLNLLPYQTAIIQRTDLIKICLQMLTEYSYWKINATIIKKFLCKFGMIILFENTKWLFSGLSAKYIKTKNTKYKG